MALLKVTGLKKHFGGIAAVDGIDFEIEPGTITSIIGPNGAGKTTAFNLISGLESADFGKIIFDGKDITALQVHERANLGIARTFQLTRVFKYLTIRENLLLAHEKHDQDLFRGIFTGGKKDNEFFTKILGMAGLKKDLQELSSKLSYGQKKLLEIARCLAMDHKILLLDEPVAGVNPKVRSEIAQILLNLKRQNETILLVEHDMNFVMDVSDKVIVMHRGKIICHGTPRQVVKNKAVLEAYLGD